MSASRFRGFGQSKPRSGYGLLPEPAVLSSARYRHVRTASNPRLYRGWLSRPLQRLLIRAAVIFGVALVAFLLFLRAHKPSKQAVEDFIKYTTQDLGLTDPRQSLHLHPLTRARIWAYELQSGRHPSAGAPPRLISSQFESHDWSIRNPAYPFDFPSNDGIVNSGLSRIYTSLGPTPDDQDNSFHPPRPSGATLDLDRVMDHCAFENGGYVSDCLALLSKASGLEAGLPSQQMLFTSPKQKTIPAFDAAQPHDVLAGLKALRGKAPPDPPTLPSFPPSYRHFLSDSPHCDHDRQPRIFHMFWTGPFTDKPYMAALSFLYSQNLGLHQGHEPDNACRPQLWFWLVPGPAVSSLVYPPDAYESMVSSLQQNMWAAQLLADRFKGVIQFHLFNATEQLDETPELASHWRSMPLFKSGMGMSMDTSGNDPMLKLVGGSTTKETYDKLSVVLSDMARFLLAHRFGGIYVDTDTLLLRDFEELFNWSGAFAYRWSRMREYNTAVMKLNRQSAIGSFIMHTALLNGLDFHPHSVYRYVKEAGLDPLMLRLPDALFDPPWLNTEHFQRDRPPHPYFQRFEEFFETKSLPEQSLNASEFFKGAFAMHYHNQFWSAFDPDRNWPEIEGTQPPAVALPKSPGGVGISWATLLKRRFEAFLRGDVPNLYNERIAVQ